MVSRTLRGLVMVGLLVVVAGAAYGLALLHERIIAALPAGPDGNGARLFANAIVPLLAILAVPIFVGFLYRVVPNVRVPWRDLVPPAIVVGIVVGLLTQLFVLIAPLLIGVLAVFGAFAVVFAALAWLSLVFQALLIGAAWTRIRMDNASGGAPPVATEAGARHGGDIGRYRPVADPRPEPAGASDRMRVRSRLSRLRRPAWSRCPSRSFRSRSPIRRLRSAGTSRVAGNLRRSAPLVRECRNPRPARLRSGGRTGPRPRAAARTTCRPGRSSPGD